MTFGQIILYAGIALIAYLYIKRFMLNRTIKQYSASEVMEKMKNSRSSILLDVRTAGERSSRSIKNSIHIPISELRNRKEELKKYKDKEIICYCQTGSRSINAASILKKDNFEVANMKGGIVRYNF